MDRYFNYARILATGAPAPGAAVEVFDVGTLVLASLFADDLTPPTPLGNPVIADTNGFFFFYAPAGHYDLRFSGGGIVAPYAWGDVAIGSIDTLTSTPQFERIGLGVPADPLYRMVADGTYASLEQDNGNSGALLTIDWSEGNVQTVTLTANCTLTFTNLRDGVRCLLGLVQDGVGGRTVTWPAIRWAGGLTPGLTAVPAQIDWVTIWQARGLVFGAAILNF